MTGRRDVVLEEVFNLRDLGGYDTLDGRRTRWGTLYRGASLHRLAGPDLELVGQLGIKTVLDLRTEAEVGHGIFPVDRLPADFYHLPLITQMWDHSAIDPAAPAEQYLAARYSEMLDEGRSSIAESVRFLARPGALPGVFYCAAGKDRTGVLAAIVLEAVGVQRDHVIADYHLSKERVAKLVERLLATRRIEATSTMVAQAATLLDAPAEAMRMLLEQLTEQHGSAAGYLLDSGVRQDELSALADSVLEAT